MKAEEPTSQKIIEDYLRESYFSVDGLWYVLIEREDSPDKSLRIDSLVWEALAKIQVRNLKKWMNLSDDGIESFAKAIEVKFRAENYSYKYERVTEKELMIEISQCPWYEILKKSNRVYLSDQISKFICSKELKTWGREFNPKIKYLPQYSICLKDDICKFSYMLNE